MFDPDTLEQIDAIPLENPDPADTNESNTNQSTLFSDGRLIYILSLQATETENKYFVDIFDPLQNFCHVRRVFLRGHLKKDANVAVGKVKNFFFLFLF